MQKRLTDEKSELRAFLELLVQRLAEKKPELKKQIGNRETLNLIVDNMLKKLSPDGKGISNDKGVMNKLTLFIKQSLLIMKNPKLMKDLDKILEPLRKDPKYKLLFKKLLENPMNRKELIKKIDEFLKTDDLLKSVKEKLDAYFKKINGALKSSNQPEMQLDHPNINLIGLVCMTPGCYIANITNNQGNAAGIVDVAPVDNSSNLGLADKTSSGIEDYTGRVAKNIQKALEDGDNTIDTILDQLGLNEPLHPAHSSIHSPFASPFKKKLTPNGSG